MDKQASQALEGSIRKWRSIVKGTGQEKGHINCPLCTEFWSFTYTTTCEGCPVYQKTKCKNCRDTPYEDFDDERDEYIDIHPLSRARDGYATTKKLRNYAQKELDFLISLREK